MSDTQLITIQTTCGDREALSNIARDLVEMQLAACVQISGPIESVYVWNGKQEASQEWLLSAKTSRKLFDQASARIQELHPYEVPEIIALPITAISRGYQSWMESQLLPNK